jgi:hypothetical protein
VLPLSFGRSTTPKKTTAKPSLATPTAASQQQLFIAASLKLLDSCKLGHLVSANKKII